MLKEGSEQFIDGLLVSDIEQECGVKITVVKDFYSFKELANIIKKPLINYMNDEKTRAKCETCIIGME